MKSKTGSKGKQSSKKPIVNAGHRRELHVPECMVWPDPSAVPNAAYQQPDRVIVTKPGLGKPVDRGYDLTENTNTGAVCELERDTAMEAIRGWPHKKQEEEHHNEFEDFMNGLGVAGGPVGNPYQEFANTKPKKGDKKKKSFKHENDANIADLVSHRFMYEAAMERQRKEQEKMMKEEQANKMMKAKRFPKDIKSNKTSQLRSIAMAEKIDSSPLDLWQMPKFKDNAQPALDTRRKKSGKSGSKSGSGKRGGQGEDGFPTCTCAEEYSGYKGADYDRNQEPDYPNVDYDDTKGADKVPMSPERQDEEPGQGDQVVAL